MGFEEKKFVVLMISLSDFTGSSTVHNMDGMTTVRLGNLLDTQHWHYVTIKRYGRDLNFTLDSQTERVLLNGEFNYLDLDNQVCSLGMTNQVAEGIYWIRSIFGPYAVFGPYTIFG